MKHHYAVTFARGLCVVAILITSIRTAAAQTEERPWAAGVSTEDQEKALALYEEGNQFFDNYRFAEAATKYREALEHWEHPAIYYNLAKALRGLSEWLSQENNLEVYENIQKALRYGPTGLPGDL